MPLAQERLVADIERRLASEWFRRCGNQEVAAGLPEVLHHFSHDLLRDTGDRRHFAQAAQTTDERALGRADSQGTEQLLGDALLFRLLVRRCAR